MLVFLPNVGAILSLCVTSIAKSEDIAGVFALLLRELGNMRLTVEILVVLRGSDILLTVLVVHLHLLLKLVLMLGKVVSALVAGKCFELIVL